MTNTKQLAGLLREASTALGASPYEVELGHRLDAAADELEKAEAVGHFYHRPHEGRFGVEWRCEHLDDGAALYTRPPAPQAPSLNTDSDMDAEVGRLVEANKWELYMESKPAPQVPDATSALERVEDMREALSEIREIYAGSEGIPVPETATEAYLIKLLTQMYQVAVDGLEKTPPAPQVPDGWREMMHALIECRNALYGLPDDIFGFRGGMAVVGGELSDCTYPILHKLLDEVDTALKAAPQPRESDEWESFLEAETNGMML